jgi:predicted transcriptional regulator
VSNAAAKPDTIDDLIKRLDEAQKELQALSSADLSKIQTALKKGIPAAEIQSTQHLSPAAMGLLQQQFQDADAAQRKLVESTKQQRDAQAALAASSDELGRGMTLQVDAALKLGNSQSKIAEAYGISEAAIKRYVDEQAFAQTRSNFNAQQDHRNIEQFKKDQADILAVRLAASNEAFQVQAGSLRQLSELNHTESQKLIDDFERLRTHMETLRDTDLITPEQFESAVGPAAQLVTARLSVVRMKEVGEAWAGDLGDGLTDGLRGALDDVPKFITQAFTGGGGLKGAGQALASDVGSKLGKSLFSGGLGNVIGDGLHKLFGGGLKSALAIGNALPGIGAAIGSLIGPAIDGLIKVFGDHAGKDFKRTGKQLGVDLSDGLVEQLKKDAKKFGGEVQAMALNLDKIVTEAGGVQAFGIEKSIAKTRDLFVLLDSGKLTAQQVGSEFDKMFGEILPHAINKMSGLATASFQELNDLAVNRKVESPQLDAFRKDQISGVLDGLTTILKDGTAKSQAQADGLTASLGASIAEMSRLGVPMLTILKQADPIIDKLSKQLKKTGLDGGAAFDQIRSDAALAKDQIAGPLLDAAASWQQVVVGLANTGGLTDTIFNGFTDSIAKTFDTLIAKGKDSDQIFRLMQPQLQTVFELTKRGFVPDDATKKILDQAVAAGKVGDQFSSAQDRMATATERTAAILEAFAKKMGIEVPSAAKTAAKGVEDAFKDVHPTVHVNFEYDDQGRPIFPKDFPGPTIDGAATGGLVTARGIQHFAGGGRVLPFLARGTDTVPAMLTPGELVLTQNQQSDIWQAIQRGGVTGRGGINVTVYASDAASVRRAIPEVTREMSKHLMRGGRPQTMFRGSSRRVA